MKKILLLISFCILSLSCFCQDSLDVQKELREIQAQRALLDEKLSLLEKGMTQKQATVDSVRGKIVQTKSELDQMKPGATKAEKKKIANHEKILKELIKEVDEITQKQSQNQLFVDKVKQVILELDQQINELSPAGSH